MKFEFSNAVQLVITKAQNLASDKSQEIVTTAHVFLSILPVLKTLANNTNASEINYLEYHDKFKEIINKHGVNGAAFQVVFNTMYPSAIINDGEELEIECGDDLSRVLSSLKQKAQALKQEMGIAELICEIFSDSAYDIYQAIKLIIDETETDALVKDIQDYFGKKTIKINSIEDFENCRGLKNLNEFVAQKPMTFVDCDHVINQLRLALNCKVNRCAALVGKAGTGKTMAVYALADAINNGMAKELNNKIIYELDIASVVSGSKFRGEFEEKLLNIVNIVKQYSDQVILFCDEMHLLMGAGESSDGAMDASNILKPYITRGEIQIIGATTNDEWQKHISKNKAFERRFQKILINEPTKEQTKKILMGLRDEYDQYFGKKASEELVDSVVDLSCKYAVDQANPARAITIFDIAYSHSKIFNENNELVMDDDARKAIQIKFDINIVENRTEETVKFMKDFILGQDEILEKIGNSLKYIDLGLVDNQKPLYSAIFAGSTGVGKTEVAKIVAERFFGSEKNFLKINMSEYASEMDVSKINGSAPGYIGYDEETDLIKNVRQMGSGVVLFDEIEKAHPKVFDTLLSVLDTGEMKSNKGDAVSFKDCVILFTTNIGYKAGHSEAKGLGFIKSQTKNEDILNEVKSHFRPEFINRIDEIIVFNSLTNEVANTLIDRYVKDYEETSSMKFELTEEDRKEICNEAQIPEYGARGLKRAVRKQLLKVATRKLENIE